MYGTAEGDPLLESRGERRSIFSNATIRHRSPLRNKKRPVLETIVSKRRLRTSVIDPPAQPKPKPKSFFYSMLNPRSVEWQAVAFKWLITIVILLDLCAFIMSTDEGLNEKHVELFATWEMGTSWVFLAEYVLRLIVVTESVKYGTMGPIKGRLVYMRTTPALIDMAATLPYFLERSTGYDLPTLTYLRSFRLLRILKTQGFSKAISSVWRVFRYNSEILFVGVWIGMAFVLITAVLMYYLRPREEEHSQFKSLPATLFLATMMLTGQGGPDGELPWYTSSVILLTGVVSIGMFAIPASMLTWGFEGEAERLAKLRKKRATEGLTRETPSNEIDPSDEWSYSSDDYSTDEEYLNTIAGFEDDSDDEEERARKTFNVVDHDGSGQISIDEFLEYSKRLSMSGETINNRLAGNRSLSTKRLEVLERKVDDNRIMLERICNTLETMKAEST